MFGVVSTPLSRMPASLGPVRLPAWSVSLGEPVVALTASSDSRWVAAMTSEGTLGILEASTGAILHRIAAHAGGGFRAVFHPNASLIATSGADGHVRFWDPSTGRSLGQVAAGSAWAEHLEWSGSGVWLAAAAGKTVTVISESLAVHRILKNHPSTVSALCWRADSEALAVGCYGGVHLYQADSENAAALLPWKTSLVSLAWSSDHRWLVAGTQDCSIQIWPLPFETGNELAMSGYPAKVRELAWHHTGKYLATGGGEQVMVWDCSGAGPAGTTPRILEGHTARVSALAYQARGHFLASVAPDGLLLVWNAKRPSPIAHAVLGRSLTTVVWLKTDETVIAGCREGFVFALTGLTS